MRRLVLRSLAIALTLSAIAAPAEAGTFTLYAIKSPNGVSWKSPRKLLASTLRNKLSLQKDKRAIGHVAISLTGEHGEDIVTGMAITKDAKRRYGKLAKDGRGLGVLLDTVEGRLEDKTQLAPELERHMEKGQLAYVKFKVSDATELRLREYLKTYQARGIDKKYGGTNRPLLAEGSGCSAFGASCMVVGGLLEPEMAKAWNRKVLLPKALIGDEQKKVKLTKLLFSKLASRFARPDEAHERLDIYDPELINHWIEDKWHDVATGKLKDGKTTIEKSGKAFGLVIDAREVETPKRRLFVK